VPAAIGELRRRLEAAPGLVDWRVGRTTRVTSGFYISQAIEMVRK
jgi:magnesium-protoporphyrin O-methyltransferase